MKLEDVLAEQFRKIGNHSTHWSKAERERERRERDALWKVDSSILVQKDTESTGII